MAKADEIAGAIDAAKSSGATALNVLASAMLYANRQIIVRRVAALGLPAIYQFPSMAEEGGLMGYGPNLERISVGCSQRYVRSRGEADMPR